MITALTLNISLNTRQQRTTIINGLFQAIPSNFPIRDATPSHHPGLQPNTGTSDGGLAGRLAGVDVVRWQRTVLFTWIITREIRNEGSNFPVRREWRGGW